MHSIADQGVHKENFNMLIFVSFFLFHKLPPYVLVLCIVLVLLKLDAR
jgi:hypothetical protein